MESDRPTLPASVDDVLIIGAGLGGARTAEALRANGYSGRLVLAGAEIHPPYDRPPLSKEFLSGANQDVALHHLDFYAEQQIELQLGNRATGLDRARRQVSFCDGTALAYQRLVVATGLAARLLPGSAGLAGVHTLRTIDDATVLRDEFRAARRLVVVGAGFIGCEVASTARAAGLRVCLVEPRPAPLSAALGDRVGALVGRLHTETGIDVRCGVGVAELLGDGHVHGVRLSDATELGADLVVSGIGSVPEVDWLLDSGLAVADGVLCDHRGRTSDRAIWAVGDAAAWSDSQTGKSLRHEHWTRVTEQAGVVARDLLGLEPVPGPTPVPYFWSDQNGMKIQALGLFRADDECEVLHDDGRKFLAAYFRAGVLAGAVACGLPAKLMALRPSIVSGATRADLVVTESPADRRAGTASSKT